MAAAREVLDRRNAVTGHLAEDRGGRAVKMFRLLPLPLLLLLALPVRAEITIQEVTSPGGIKAWLVEDHGIPFTALEIRFEGGTSLDAPGKRGAVNLMTALLEEGAGDLDAQGFAAARDGLAAEFRVFGRCGFGRRFGAVSDRKPRPGDGPAARGDPGAALRSDAVERVRGQILSNLRSNAKDPQTPGVGQVRRAGLRRPSLRQRRRRHRGQRDGADAGRHCWLRTCGRRGARPDLCRGRGGHHGEELGAAAGQVAGRSACERRTAAGAGGVAAGRRRDGQSIFRRRNR